MADLVTTIAADDREFREGLGRVDSRITSFAGSVRGMSSLVKGAFAGFGALGAAKALVNLAESVHRVWEEAEAARYSLSSMGQAAVDAGRARERTLSGSAESDQDIRDEAEQRIKDMRDAANKERVRLAGLSWLDRQYYQAATGKTPDEASKEIEASTNENEKRIRAQAERTVKARRDKEKRDYWDSQYNAEREFKDFQKTRRSNLNDLRDGMTDEKINLLDGAGLGNAADTARLKERLRRKLEEIDQNEMLAPNEKRISRDFYEEAYKSNKMLLDQQSIESWRSKAKSFQGNIGGATFQQQMADIQRPLNTVAEEIRDQVIQAVEKLDEISAKSGSPSYR